MMSVHEANCRRLRYRYLDRVRAGYVRAGLCQGWRRFIWFSKSGGDSSGSKNRVALRRPFFWKVLEPGVLSEAVAPSPANQSLMPPALSSAIVASKFVTEVSALQIEWVDPRTAAFGLTVLCPIYFHR